MRHSIGHYQELPEYGTPEEIREFEDFLNSMCWDFETFILHLEWEEWAPIIVEEHLTILECLEIDYWAEKREELFPSIC